MGSLLDSQKPIFIRPKREFIDNRHHFRVTQGFGLQWFDRTTS